MVGWFCGMPTYVWLFNVKISVVFVQAIIEFQYL